jgi:predicted nuclease of predicted toxin-antitoxin system
VKAWPQMRLLLDECVPSRLKRALSTHQVSTVPQEVWSDIKNGKLLALATTKFDVFIAVDKNLTYQHNTSKLSVSVLFLDAVSNKLPYLLPLLPQLEAALLSHPPGSYVQLRAEI